jgi:predicted 2-oxoglutarate/Fe(II)-dependent dioxygenase YbiX
LAKADGRARKVQSVNRRAVSSDVPLLILPAFFDVRVCEWIRRGMDHGAEDAADIVGDEIATRNTVRRGRSLEVDAQLLEFVETRIEGARPAIERTVGRPLGEREGTGFLRYPAGGFYRQHRDRGKVAGWPAAAKRLMTVVVFLNGGVQHAARRDFEGGQLCLYPARGTPIEIPPETGLLVAFPADCLHEVRPVLTGTRDAAIDWFYDPPPRSEPSRDPYRI